MSSILRSFFSLKDIFTVGHLYFEAIFIFGVVFIFKVFEWSQNNYDNHIILEIASPEVFRLVIPIALKVD